jgi:hypothetical protein
MKRREINRNQKNMTKADCVSDLATTPPGSESSGERSACRNLANVLSPKNCLIRIFSRNVDSCPSVSLNSSFGVRWRMPAGIRYDQLQQCKSSPKSSPAKGEQFFSLKSRSEMCRVPKAQ